MAQLNPADAGQLNLYNPDSVLNQKVDLTPRTDENSLIDLSPIAPQAQLGMDVIQQRTGKYDFALGDNSPGAAHIASLVSANQEDSLRTQAVSADTIKQMAAKESIIHDMLKQPNITQENIDSVKNMSQADVANKDTILERMYANNLVNSALSGTATQTDDPVKQEHIYQLADAATDQIARNEIAKKKLTDLEAANTWMKNPVGRTNSLLGDFIPLVGWAQVKNQVSDLVPMGVVGEGAGKDRIIQYLMAIPKEEFDRVFPKIIDRVAAVDPIQASELAKGVIMRTTTAGLRENAGQVLNAATWLPGGKLLDMLLGTKTAVRAPQAIVGATQDVGKVIDKTGAAVSPETLSKDVLATRKGNVGVGERPIAGNENLETVPRPSNDPLPPAKGKEIADMRTALSKVGVKTTGMTKEQVQQLYESVRFRSTGSDVPAKVDIGVDNFPKENPTGIVGNDNGAPPKGPVSQDDSPDGFIKLQDSVGGHGTYYQAGKDGTRRTEKISAFRINGHIYTGETHTDAMEKAIDDLGFGTVDRALNGKNAEDFFGYMRQDKDGKVVERGSLSKDHYKATKGEQRIEDLWKAERDNTLIEGFVTAKGSKYKLNPDGTTVRDKSYHPEHGPEDQGIKPASEKTVYVQMDAARRLATPDGEWRIIDHNDGTLSLTTKNKAGGWGIAPSQKQVPVFNKPSEGAIPIELWNKEQINGLDAYKKVHFGNEITQLIKKDPKDGDIFRGEPFEPDDPRLAAESVLDSTVRANNGTMANTVENIVAATGNNSFAQTLNVVKRFTARMMAKDPTMQMQELETHLSSLFSAEKFYSSTFALSKEGADRLLALAEKNNDLLAQVFTNTGRVQRLDPVSIPTVIENLKTKMASVYGTKLKDGILGAEYIGPEGQWLNRHSVNLRIGKSSTADFFDSAKEANTWASKFYGLQDGTYKIVERHGKYEINSIRDVDETGTNIQALVGKSDTNTGFWTTFHDLLKVGSADRVFDAVGNANRKVATYATPRIQALIHEAIKPIGKLSKDSVRDLSSFIQANQGVGTGKWYNTVSEFERAWLQRYNRIPNEKEIAAYDAYHRVSDIDWMLRNGHKLSQMSRLGIEQVQLKFSMAKDGVNQRFVSPYFNGIIKDTLPLESKHEFAFFTFNPDKTTSVRYRSSLTVEERQAFTIEIKDGGYKIIQVHESEMRPLKDFLGESTPGSKQEIHFVLAKDVATKRLEAKQIGYSEGGGHLIYAAKAYVKQAKTQWNGNRKMYLDDTTITPHGSMAEAKEFAVNLNQARVLYRDGKYEEFDKFVSEHLPMEPRDLYGKFRDGYLDPKQEIHAVLEGKSVAETVDLGIHDNMKDSPFRTSRLTTGQFEGEKNSMLQGVEEGSGTQSDPLFKYSQARVVDPYTSLSRGIGDATRSWIYNDYRIKAVQDFVNKFHTSFDSSKVTLDDLQRNPFYYFNNPEQFLKKEFTPKTIRAWAQLRQINALLNKNTMTQDVIRQMNNHVLDTVYKKLGIDAAAAVDEKLLSKITDPVAYLRSVAFHLKMGLFHVPTLFAQLSTIGTGGAISGFRDGFSGFANLWLLNAARFTENPNILAKLDSIASKIGSKPGQFTEMRNELMRAGYHVVGGEHAFLDQIRDPKIFRGVAGQFLDKGTVFFREGERQARMSGFAMAFQTFKRQNPGKVIDDSARGWIANRADVLNNQMSRASSAAWQKGVLSLPTQFMGYPMRLMEQLMPFSKTLTSFEKTRLAAYLGAVFGVPAVATGLVPIHNWSADVRQAAEERGIRRDDKFYSVLSNGFGELLANSIFGDDANWSERFGPQAANNEVDKWWKQDPTFDLVGLATGATGSALSDVFSHGWAAFVRPMFDGSIKATSDDFIRIFRDASTGDKLVRAYYGLQFSKWLAKNDKVLEGDTTAQQILENFVLGLTPKTIQSMYDKTESGYAADAAKRKASTDINEELRRAALALSSGTQEDYRQHFANALAMQEAAGLTTMEFSKLVNHALYTLPEVDRINEKFIKQSPYDQQLDRAKALQPEEDQ